jgi:hypothetical protein
MTGNPIYPEFIFFSGGLITVTNGSDEVTGSINAVAGTVPVWTSSAFVGDTIAIGPTRHYIKQIVDDDTIILTEPWSGASAGPVAYTGVRSPWHLDGRAIAYKMAKFLEQDATASATAVIARDEALGFRNEAQGFRNESEAWSNRPAGQDVTTPGTRSALHHAQASSTSATASETARAAGVVARTGAETAATLAQAWASRAVDQDVTTAGTRSALHHATKAAASETVVVANAATAVAAKDGAESARGLSEEWARKPHGQSVTGTADGRSSLHYATEAANSAAAAAALVHAAVNYIDYGFITDLPTDVADYGTLS